MKRRAPIILVAAAAVLAAVVLLLMAFPVGMLKGTAERRLSERFGRPVTIAAIEREGGLSLSPVIRVTGVRVPQAAWAGPGDLAYLRLLRIRVRLLPLLVGRFSPQVIAASGVRLDLVRAADGRTNWGKPEPDKQATGGDAPRLDALGIADAAVRYRDAKQRRTFTLNVRVDPQHGLAASGRGDVDGAPVTVAARGGPVRPEGPWPFSVGIDGPLLAMTATGHMAAPLDTDHMTFRMTARADDLKRIDRVIEAGLFGTQPVRLSAEVQHRDKSWQVERLTGTIGRSRLTGRIGVDKVDGRTRLDGEVHASALDLADLSSDEGLARAAALERAEGQRVVPNTRVNLAKIDRTDGRIAFRADRLLSRRSSTLTSMAGVLTLDRQRLVVEPLRIGLTRGAISGRAVVDQRGGAREPLVTLALDLTGSTLGTIAGDVGEVDARVDGRVRLTGRGSTIRAAVGRSNGTVGLVARDGSLPAKMAAMLGFDVGRSLLTGGSARATLRCAVVRLPVRDGRGTFAPLVVDTSLSQTRGTGTLTFPAERIAATLTGEPKGGSVLRLPGAIQAGGTIKAPEVVVPRETKSAGNIFKAIGRAITGRQGPTASDADCGALSRQAIGR